MGPAVSAHDKLLGDENTVEVPRTSSEGEMSGGGPLKRTARSWRHTMACSAVVGSITALISATEVIGNPPRRACSRTASSLGAMCTQ